MTAGAEQPPFYEPMLNTPKVRADLGALAQSFDDDILYQSPTPVGGEMDTDDTPRVVLEPGSITDEPTDLASPLNGEVTTTSGSAEASNEQFDTNSTADLDHPYDSARTYLQSIHKLEAPLLTAEQEVDLAKRIEAGIYAEFILAVQQAQTTESDLDICKIFAAELAGRRLKQQGGNGEPSLETIQKYRKRAVEDVTPLFDAAAAHPASKEVAEQLEYLAQDGRQCQQRFAASNVGLVVSIAKRYIRSGLEFSELIQQGNLGLMRAVQKFDYTKGCKFSTYATWWIDQSIRRGINDIKRTIRIPEHIHERLGPLARVERDLSEALGRDPTVAEVAAELDVTEGEVEKLRYTRQLTVCSLDMLVGDEEDNPFSDLIVEDKVTADDVITWQLYGTQVDDALRDYVLTPMEYQVLTMRNNGEILQAIGLKFGFSREKARAIDRIARLKLLHPSSPARVMLEVARGRLESSVYWQPNCIEVGTAAMFVRGADQKHVKQICGGCALLETCRVDGLAQRSQIGVWGRLTEGERKAMLKDNPTLADTARADSNLFD